jgi:acetyl-CoA acetyltransferase
VTTNAVIVGATGSPYWRNAPKGTTTGLVLADALVRLLETTGITREEVDGLGLASFTLVPDRAIDMAWKLGLRPRWLMDDANGGVSGIQLIQHAMRALEAGDAETIVLLSGDHFTRTDFARLADNYNRTTAQYLAGIPHGGPNALFAMVTRRQMERYGLERADYGRLVVAQRRWAALNPRAVYRSPITLEDYLAAPPVVEPLHRLDCVPIVTGADALLLRAGGEGVRIRALRSLHNWDGQEGDGLTTGVSEIADRLFAEAGAGPEDMDVISVYDDYPAMALAQLVDLGYVPDGDVSRFLRERVDADRMPVNTSGGQLSAGQAGTAGGMIGVVEAVAQLLGQAGDRQVAKARLALVTGYGMVLYRYGGCANAIVLEGPS